MSRQLHLSRPWRPARSRQKDAYREPVNLLIFLLMNLYKLELVFELLSGSWGERKGHAQEGELARFVRPAAAEKQLRDHFQAHESSSYTAAAACCVLQLELQVVACRVSEVRKHRDHMRMPICQAAGTCRRYTTGLAAEIRRLTKTGKTFVRKLPQGRAHLARTRTGLDYTP
jgi:hypothetical protein